MLKKELVIEKFEKWNKLKQKIDMIDFEEIKNRVKKLF